MAESAFTWGNAGEKLTPSERRRKIAEAMILRGSSTAPIQHWTQGAARVAEALLGGYESGQIDREDKAAQARVSADASLMGMPGAAAPATLTASAPSMTGGASRTMALPNITPEIKDGIVQTASALGISPVDLATTISYETGGTFDPTKAGPTTKWGQHRGLIQFGEPQAKQYGVDWSNPVGSQLGPNGAVAAYLRDRGVKPGMGLMDIYSTINAGAPGLYNRSDVAAGGAPGTVADKVNNQMAGHRAKAQALFADLPAPGAAPVEMQTGQPGFAIPGDDPAKLRSDAEYYAQSNPEAARQMLARADAVAPAATQELPSAPAMTGATFNAIANGVDQAPLDPVFQTEGVSQPWMGTALAPAAPVAPRVAQAPMPPPRPADLPAPGAVEAIGQAPVVAAPVAAAPAPIIADPTKDNAGVLSGLVASEEARKGLPSGAGIMSPFGGAPAPAASPAAANDQSVFSRIASALGGGSAAPASPAAAPSPAVQAVASALPAQASPAAAPSAGTERVAAAMRVLNSPYAQPGQRAVATMIVQQAFKDPTEAELKRLTVEKARREAENAPLDTEGKRLEIEGKKKALGKAEAPTVQRIKQPDGSEVAVQWDQGKKAWVPLEAPQGGNAVGGSASNPYALPGKPTESQSKDAGFASRMVESHNQITGLEGVGTDKKQAMAGSVPYIGNQISSPEKQKFEQAKRNFVTAILRKESGAAISAGEFETEEKKYFPQVGDSPDVIKQKREARELAIEGVMAGAGSGYKVPDSYKPTRGKAIDTSKPGSFKFNPATGKMEPA